MRREGGAILYFFGNYVLATERHELHHAGEPVKLRRKVFQVLVHLLAHRDQVLSKQELFEDLWPDKFFGEAALSSCIKALRWMLGERGRAPRFLRTLHGHGYRLVAAVEVRDRNPMGDELQAPPAGEGQIEPRQAFAAPCPFGPPWWHEIGPPRRPGGGSQLRSSSRSTRPSCPNNSAHASPAPAPQSSCLPAS